MPAKNVSVLINREARSIKPGLVRGKDVLKLADASHGHQLFLEDLDGVKILISVDDILHIRGGEIFGIFDGHPHISDFPTTNKPVAFTVNDVQVLANPAKPHSKHSGAEIKELVGKVDVDLWLDLDGIGDELLTDLDTIILREHVRFFTVPRDVDDRFYEVSVILDGEDKQRRFAALMTVREAMRRSLPVKDRPQVNDFDMVDGNLGTAPLNPDFSLKEAGVRDGHILSITKKNGGGGWGQ